jgi:hypothetical protein
MPAECSTFRDKSGPRITVRIKNETQNRIYVAAPLGTCTTRQYFDVFDEDETPVASQMSQCASTCAYFMSKPPDFCEPLCHTDVVVGLEPGASLEEAWVSSNFVRADLPASCAYSEDEVADCRIEQPLAAGTYQFVARAGQEASCPDRASGCEACDPSAEGRCYLESAEISGETLTAELGVDFNADGWPDTNGEPVELVFSDP